MFFNNNNQGPFVPLGSFVFSQPNQPQVQQECSFHNPPARVQFALEVLRHFTSKTTSRPAANEHVIEWSEPAKLSKDEILTEISACNLIQEYLRGNMELNAWEADSVAPEMVGDETESREIACPYCQNHADKVKSCEFCNKHGGMLLVRKSAQ